MAISKHLCENCKHYTISLCCDRPICNEMNWDPSEFDKDCSTIDEFLTERASEWTDDYCCDYEYALPPDTK